MSVTPLGAAPADLAEVTRIVREAGTSFRRGMASLPPDRRSAMYAIYAFCRKVDDIADGPGAFDAKTAGLDAWRSGIDELYRGHAEESVTRVLLLAIGAFELRREDFHAVIDGMAMDAGPPIVAPNWAVLDLYCDRVAAAVGRLSVRAFGDASAAADLVAHHLGRALQLTNILRDVHEDARLGRLYLPREWLMEAGVAADVSAAGDPRVAAVCRRLAARAHHHFNEAAAAMRRCDWRAMRPARLMGAAYTAVLEQLEQRGWDRLDVPARVPKWRKLWIATRYGIA